MKHLLEFESFFESLGDFFDSAVKNLTKENPEGANKGDKVESMQTKVGTTPGQPWCAAYVYSVFADAGLPKEIMDKIPRTPSVKQLWEQSTKAKKITREDALANPDLVKPGMVFCYLTKNSSGKHGPAGHTGIVANVYPKEKAWEGFEGNANPIDGSREGYGTFFVKRNIADPSISSDEKERPALLLGFIDYLDGFRQGPDYLKFQKELSQAISKYQTFTKSEIQRLKSNPEISDIHAKNYKNRFKS